VLSLHIWHRHPQWFRGTTWRYIQDAGLFLAAAVRTWDPTPVSFIIQRQCVMVTTSRIRASAVEAGGTFNVSDAGITASTSLGGQFTVADNPLSPLSQFGGWFSWLLTTQLDCRRRATYVTSCCAQLVYTNMSRRENPRIHLDSPVCLPVSECNTRFDIWIKRACLVGLCPPLVIIIKTITFRIWVLFPCSGMIFYRGPYTQLLS
jgi:hypothetical protein